ncbi:hypothetical protein Tco_1543492, partial [Tanacetum coccineum]
QILDGKLMFMDDDGNPLAPMSNVDSESEVEVVFDETANLMASTSFKGGSDKGYGTNSLLEQWREIKGMMSTTRLMTIYMKVMICLITFRITRKDKENDAFGSEEEEIYTLPKMKDNAYSHSMICHIKLLQIR